MKHDLTASSCCPGVTLLSRELLESNTPSENPKYETDVKELLKDKKNRKDIVTAVNTFVQGKLNTLATKEALSSFNETVKSKKLLNKLVTDEHYLVMNNSGLQVVDSKKDIKGKPIDLDKRSHRKLVGKYLSYLAKDTKALNTDQKQAASDLVSYIEELNALADEHSLAVDQVLHKSKRGKELREVIMNSKNTYKELNKSVAKALNKDLNLDSTKYSYLEAGTFDGLKISEKEVQVNEKIKVVKGKLEEALKDENKVTLPSGVTYTIGKTELINAPLANAGLYTADVNLKEGDKPLGKLTLTVDENGTIENQTGDIKDYKVTLADEKLTVKTEAQAQEDEKSDEVKGKIVNNIGLLPDSLTSTVTPIKNAATGLYDTATAEFKAADGKPLGTLTLTVDPQGNITAIKDGGTIAGYDVTFDQATKKLTVTKKKEEEVKTETKDNNNINATLFTGLTPPTGKKILDLSNSTIKTKLEKVFTAIKDVSGYKDIVKTIDEDGVTGLDATIKAFQAQYMVLNKSKNHIGGKSDQPDGKIGPKTLAAMREVLGVSDTSDQGNNNNGGGNEDGVDDTKNQPKENGKKGGSGLDGTEESPANSEKNKEKLKKEYECLFDPKDSKSQCGVEIENQTFDSFNLHMSSGGKDVIIKFTVTRDNSTGKITEIRAKDHINDSNEFYQSGTGKITIAPRGNRNNIATYKINKNKKEFLVGYDATANDGKGKRLYDVVDTQQNQIDIVEKLKNEYLGLFKKYNDNNNQYNVEISNPTNNSFIIKLTKDGTTKSFIFDVRRKFNNEIENMSIRLSRNDKLYSQTFTDDKNIYSIKYENNQWSHNVVPKISS